MIPIISRHHIETYILGSVINGHICPPLDEMEFMEMQLEYDLFKATYTNKLVAKAIFNMKNEGLPIDDVLLKNYIDSKTDKLNYIEYLNIICAGTGSFISVQNYLKVLKDIDKEERLWDRV